MLSSYNSFCKLVEDTKNVEVLYKYITNTVVVSIDISDLLRWQWVQCVSALDKLVHDLVRIGMVEIYQGTRASTPKFNSFIFDIKTFLEMIRNPADAVTIFERKVIMNNGYKAFQDPSKIADALSNIWNENDKWDKISSQMLCSKQTCVTTLKNIVFRRNQIVHEGDYPDTLSKRQDIFEGDVVEVRDFILKLGKSIYECIK